MHVMVDDRYWDSGTYCYKIPISRKLKKALKKLDKAGLIPGGVDAFVELIAQETIGTTLAQFYDPLCAPAVFEEDTVERQDDGLDDVF